MPNLSKVYERLMYNQIYPYFDTLFSGFQCGFWKGFNAQHCLLAMIEKWHKTLDKDGETGAVFTDLSKQFDCDMFFEMSKNIDFAGYADNNTPYTYSSNIEEMLENLQGTLDQLFQ